MAYIGSKNNIALLDFTSCVIGEQPETLEVGDTSVYCWRKMASSNLENDTESEACNVTTVCVEALENADQLLGDAVEEI